MVASRELPYQAAKKTKDSCNLEPGTVATTYFHIGNDSGSNGHSLRVLGNILLSNRKIERERIMNVLTWIIDLIWRLLPMRENVFEKQVREAFAKERVWLRIQIKMAKH